MASKRRSRDAVVARLFCLTLDVLSPAPLITSSEGVRLTHTTVLERQFGARGRGWVDCEWSPCPVASDICCGRSQPVQDRSRPAAPVRVLCREFSVQVRVDSTLAAYSHSHTVAGMTRRTSLVLLTALMGFSLLPLASTQAADRTAGSFTVSGQELRFNPSVVDYVMYNCAERVTKFNFTQVAAADRINGRKLNTFKRKNYQWSKTMKADEIVTIFLSSRARTYYVRCLPDDFPRIDLVVKKPNETLNGFYLLPYYSRSLQGQNFTSRYYIITDSRGTPVWYRRTNGGATVLTTDGAGRLVTEGVIDGMSPGVARPENTVNIITLDGKLLGSLRPQADLVRPVQRTTAGNFVMLSAPRREHVDFTGLSTKFKDNSNGVCSMAREDVTVLGLQISEVDAEGNVLHTLDLTDRIGFNEPSQASVVNVALPGSPAECVLDLFHQNHVSLTEDGSGYVVSLRWSGVYLVDRLSGEITWKLGGSPTPRSLQVVSDPLGVTGPVAQHGGYLTADNRLLVFDNQLQKHILARAVEYYIDPVGRTASYLRSFSLGASFCVTTDGSINCPASSQGNAEYLAGGEVLVSWGNTDGRSHLATLFASDGSEIATMHSRSAKGNVFTVAYAPASMFRLADLRRYASSAPESTVRNGTYP